MGSLNDHLLPSVEERSEFDMGLKSNASTSRAGTYPQRYILTLLMIVSIYGTHTKDVIKEWPKFFRMKCIHFRVSPREKISMIPYGMDIAC